MRKILILFVSLFLCFFLTNDASAAKRDPFLGAMDDDRDVPRPPKLVLLPDRELVFWGSVKMILGAGVLYASVSDTCTPESLWCAANSFLKLASFFPLLSGMKDLVEGVTQYFEPYPIIS